MKVSPVVNPSGQPGQSLGSVDVGRTADPIKMERARAIARGEVIEAPMETEERPKLNPRSIKMRTQQSVYRDGEGVIEAAPLTESSTPAPTEEAVVEATQPLSPQFAALAKQKRALQLERAELDKQKAQLAESQGETSAADLIAQLKSNPLSVLQQHGVTYDQLTEAILNGSSGLDPQIQELKAELKALKEGVDKTLVDRDTAAEQAALGEMRKEADLLSREGEAFELVRETKSVPQVIDLIHRTYKETGEVLDVQEAMQLVEDELIENSLRVASYKKVQSRIAPPPAPALQSQQKRSMTLTARDTATPAMDRRARAIAAMTGTLKR